MKETNASPKDAALKLALEALEVAEHFVEEYAASKYYYAHVAATTAIKEALAQPEEQHSCDKQEPVAIVDSTISGHIDWLCTFFPKQGTKLYTTQPQPQSEARGLSQSKPLTDKDIFDNLNSIFGDPKHHKIPLTRGQIIDFGRKMFDLGTKPCTTPPQRTWVSLTDEDIEHIIVSVPFAGEEDYEVVIRAATAKLKEKNT